MTGEHVRRAVVLLFLFNLALMAQNWRTSERIKDMNVTAASTLKATEDARLEYQKGNDHIDQVVKQLNDLIEKDIEAKKATKGK